MLQVEYRLKLGQDEFIIKAEVKDEKEFFETLSFYSNLPKTAPGGSTDLKLSFRTTTEGHKYYSLVSEKEKMEFKFGQNIDKNGGGLFPKGWAPTYQGETTQQNQTPVGVQAVTQRPLPTQPQSFNPPPGPVVTQQAAPMPTPVQAPVTPQAVAPNPQVAAVASNVLARFGINK